KPDENKSNAWARDHIFGIEKDYRLARVAKISLFMNGAGEGNIIFGDGLENAPDKGIENGTFDILVANPPYSVKDFKQHLQLKNNSFTLLDRIGLNGGEIETLFVERIGQLLKPQGIAAVILPSSILSNDSASYTGAREQLLQNFYIRGIAAFGSKTFGATGINTVVMFLEKFNEPPKRIDLSTDSVDAIFSGSELTDWKDKEILEAYLAQIEVGEEEYRTFLKKEYSLEKLEQIEYFKMYVAAFADSSDARNLKKTKAYKSKSSEEQEAAYLEKLYLFAHSVEQEKLFYFSLVYQQNTVVITAPTDNQEQKGFLGYDWSNRKGNEGIQILTPGGKMYNDADRTADGTLANAIKKSFEDIPPAFDDNQTNLGFVIATKDLLDFSRVTFKKSINLRANKKINYQTKYDKKPLGQLAVVLKGTSITQAEAIPGDYKVVAGGVDYAYMHNEYNREANVITVSASGANAGYVNYWTERIFASDCSTIRAESDVLTQFIYYILKFLQEQIYQVLQRGSGQPHVYADDLKLIPIPDAPSSIQEAIVNECKRIDEDAIAVKATIKEYYEKIDELFGQLDTVAIGTKRLRLSNSDIFDISIGQRVLNAELIAEGSIPVYSANVVKPFGYIDKLLNSDFSVPSVLWGIDGDWMTSYMPENRKFYPTDHCGVLRCKTEEVNPRYLVHILEVEGRKMVSLALIVLLSIECRESRLPSRKEANRIL
ncbi:MAG: N-6 DNA methylase, partial [Clostridia bacterium]|nr:N-6 DNA methylase [Clostridia bacterium]